MAKAPVKKPATKAAIKPARKSVGKVTDKAAAGKIKAFDPYAHLKTQIVATEKAVGVAPLSITEEEDRIFPGTLTVGLMMGGGYASGGVYFMYGDEGSGKTTQAIMCAGSIVTHKEFNGISALFDFENCLNVPYSENIWRHMNNGRQVSVDQVFGTFNADGSEKTPGRMRYYTPANGEAFYRWVIRMLKALPSVYLMDGQYFYIYENTTANRNICKGHYDPDYLAKYNKFKVPAPNGYPQLVVIVDSYAAMNPAATQEKDGDDKSMASGARMHAKGFNTIKPLLREKRCIMIFTNQTRENISTGYGGSKQPVEFGGRVPKFYSDARFRISVCAPPKDVIKSKDTGKTHMEEEPSVDGLGFDTYSYARIHSFKNKMGGPQKATHMLRMYVRDNRGRALGVDRVWDCWTYLNETGQTSGPRKKFKIVAPPFLGLTQLFSDDGTLPFEFEPCPWEGITVTWMEFKTLIDGKVPQIAALCDAKGVKQGRILEWCHGQLGSGVGYHLYTANQSYKDIKGLDMDVMEGDFDDVEEDEDD